MERGRDGQREGGMDRGMDGKRGRDGQREREREGGR